MDETPKTPPVAGKPAAKPVKVDDLPYDIPMAEILDDEPRKPKIKPFPLHERVDAGGTKAGKHIIKEILEKGGKKAQKELDEFDPYTSQKETPRSNFLGIIPRSPTIEKFTSKEVAKSLVEEQAQWRESVKIVKKQVDKLYDSVNMIITSYDKFIDASLDKQFSGDKLRGHTTMKGILEFAQVGAKRRGELGKNAELYKNLNRLEENFEYLEFLKNALDKALAGKEVTGNIGTKMVYMDAVGKNPDKMKQDFDAKGKISRKITVTEDGKQVTKVRVVEEVETEKMREIPHKLELLHKELETLSLRNQKSIIPPIRDKMSDVLHAIDVLEQNIMPLVNKKSSHYSNAIAYVHPGSHEKREMLKDAGFDVGGGPSSGRRP